MFFNVGVKGEGLYNLLSENKEFRHTVSIAKADEVKELFGSFNGDISAGLINVTMNSAPTFMMYYVLTSCPPKPATILTTVKSSIASALIATKMFFPFISDAYGASFIDLSAALPPGSDLPERRNVSD